MYSNKKNEYLFIKRLIEDVKNIKITDEMNKYL